MPLNAPLTDPRIIRRASSLGGASVFNLEPQKNSAIGTVKQGLSGSSSNAPAYRFYVTLNGFRCAHQTYDDLFQSDGVGDEIQAGVSARVVSPDGATRVASVDHYTARVYGQSISGFPPVANPTRVTKQTVRVVGQGGPEPSYFDTLPSGYGTGAGRFGGIVSGDAVPTAWPYLDNDWRGVKSAYPDSLPMLLFDKAGRIDDVSDDTLLLTPHLIEWDGGTGIADLLREAASAFEKHVPEIIKAAGVSSGNPIAWGVLLASKIAGPLVDLLTDIFGKPGNRAIGLNDKRQYDPSSFILGLSPAALQWASAANWGFGPGVWPFSRTDNFPKGDGDYTGYLQFHYSQDAV